MALNEITQKIHGFPDWHARTLEDFEDWIDKVKGRTGTTIYRGQRKFHDLIIELVGIQKYHDTFWSYFSELQDFARYEI